MPFAFCLLPCAFSLMLASIRRLDGQVSQIHVVPQPVEKFFRHRFFEVEFKSLPVSGHAKVIGVRAGERLNIGPAPTAPVLLCGRNVINAIVAKAKDSVASTSASGVACGNSSEALSIRVNRPVSHRLGDAASQFSGDAGGYVQDEIESELAVTRQELPAVF